MIRLFKRLPKTTEEKNRLRADRMLLVLSGLLLGAGFPPVPFPIALFFGMVPFLIVIQRRESLLEINRAAYLMSFVFSLVTLYWVGGYTEGKDPYLMIGGILLFFVNPIAFLIPATLYHLTKKYLLKKAAIIFFPLFWVCYEYLYTLTDWSFPWLNLGNGMSNFILFTQIADIIGAFGISLLVVSINVCLYFLWDTYTSKKRLAVVPALIAGMLMLLPLLYGWVKLSVSHRAPDIRVGMVQPNLDPYDKWAGENNEAILNGYLRASETLLVQQCDILFFPETALPVYFLAPSQAATKDRLFAFLRRSHIPLITGMPDIQYYSAADKKPYDVKHSDSPEFYYATYNAIYALQPDSVNIQRYGKMKLVPFGERVPFVDQIPLLGDLMRWGVGLSGWNVGQESTVFHVFIPNKNRTVRVGGLVCYESIYGEMAARLVANGAQLLAVVTNDSWYGNTSGPYQHRDYAKLRAIETRRYVIRAANGGITCIIDQCGRIAAQTKMFEQTNLAGSIEPLDEITFYVQHPLLVPGIALVVSMWCCGVSLMKRVSAGKKAKADEPLR